MPTPAGASTARVRRRRWISFLIVIYGLNKEISYIVCETHQTREQIYDIFIELKCDGTETRTRDLQFNALMLYRLSFIQQKNS